jgi:hypothetical protein
MNHPLHGRLSRFFVFTGKDFVALQSAKAWCNSHNVAYGPEGSYAIGLKLGECGPCSLTTMSAADQADLDGMMFGNFRDGPVYISLFDQPSTDEGSVDIVSLECAGEMLSRHGASELAEEVHKVARMFVQSAKPLLSSMQSTLH